MVSTIIKEMVEEVILVDENDNAIGKMEKLAVHQKGLLHRAFSINIFNSNGEILLQKRAANKYHSGGLWTNTCCSHPRPNEKMEDALQRKLIQEMGFTCALEKSFEFIYKTEFEDGLIEHEFDHVYTGIYEGKINPNPHEVESYRYISLDELGVMLKEKPADFTVWFKIIYPKLIEKKIGKD